MDKIQETIYGYQACLGKKPDNEPGDIWEIKGYANAEDDMPAEVRNVKLPIGQLRRAYPELFPAPVAMKCPKCGKGLELDNADMNLDRNGLRVWITCSDNCCPFSKVLDLSIDDIIGIGKDPETEAQTRDAVRRAMNKVTKQKMRMPSGNPRAYW